MIKKLKYILTYQIHPIDLVLKFFEPKHKFIIQKCSQSTYNGKPFIMWMPMILFHEKRRVYYDQCLSYRDAKNTLDLNFKRKSRDSNWLKTKLKYDSVSYEHVKYYYPDIKLK